MTRCRSKARRYCEEMPEVAKLLGHGNIAHRVMRGLSSIRVRTVEGLADLTDEQIDALPGVGPAGVALVRRELARARRAAGPAEPLKLRTPSWLK